MQWIQEYYVPQEAAQCWMEIRLPQSYQSRISKPVFYMLSEAVSSSKAPFLIYMKELVKIGYIPIHTRGWIICGSLLLAALRLKHTQKANAQASACPDALVSEQSSFAAAFEGPVPATRTTSYPKLQFSQLILLNYILSFFSWDSVSHSSLCVQEMRDISPRPLCPLKQKVWNLSQWVASEPNSSSAPLGTSFPGSLGQLLTAKSGCQGVLRGQATNPRWRSVSRAAWLLARHGSLA